MDTTNNQNGQKASPAYRRMYETKNVRPYYTVPHLGIFGRHFRELVGFEYQHPIYVISPEMNSEGYHEIGELARATEYFREFWADPKKIKSLIKDVERIFDRAARIEAHGWKQRWQNKDEEVLVAEMNRFFEMLFQVFTRMIVSQPQHVSPLDEKLKAFLVKHPGHDDLLSRATAFPGDMPWAEEERQIGRLYAIWERLSSEEQARELERLVSAYGWFNEIEGDKPFDTEHYRKKVVEFSLAETREADVFVPWEGRRIGRLIGQLGFLRFWNRYHFMSIRYHLKKILEELVRRSGNPFLEFATVEEMERYFAGADIDVEGIRARRNGYAAHFQDGMVRIVTGDDAERFRRLVEEKPIEKKEIRGVVANKGKAVGMVRVVSFTAKDYGEQVKAFRKGEILVTGMTRPQIVHLCRLAAAIVTDEGGITSHAAVVSREFDIPCIIATHDATRTLRTGDLVEVDANEGVVRKVENS